MLSINSLRTKSILCVLIPLFLVLVLVAFIGFYSFEQVTRAAAQDLALGITQFSADRVSGELHRYSQVLQDLAAEAPVQSLDLPGLEAALRDTSLPVEMFDAGIGVYNREGVALGPPTWVQEKQRRHFPVASQFDQIRQTRQPVFSDVFRDGVSGEEVILVGVPILGSNRGFKGVLAGMVQRSSWQFFLPGGPPGPPPPFDDTQRPRPFPPPWLPEEPAPGEPQKFRRDREGPPPWPPEEPAPGEPREFRRGRGGPPWEVLIVDGKGQMIYPADSSPRVPYLSETSARGSTPPILPGSGGERRGVGVVFTRDSARNPIIVGFASLSGTNWTLITQQRWDTFLPRAEVRPYLKWLLGLLALGGILSGAMISFSIGRVLGPIQTLTQSARRLAEGHFDPIKVAPTGDEIEVLAQQFNGMAQALQKSFADLEQRVADRTRELSALYEVTALASESLDWETILARSLERALGAVRSMAGAIYLRDEGEGKLHLAVQQGLSSDRIASLESLPLDLKLWEQGLEPGPQRETTDYGPRDHPERETTDYGPRDHGTTDPEAGVSGPVVSGQWSPQGGQWSPGNGVSLPMRAREGVVGLLFVLQAEGQPPFTEEERALLTSLADQVGVVVESHRLRQRAEQAAVLEERQRLARDLHDSVTQSLYSVTLLAETSRLAAQAGDLKTVEDCQSRQGQVTQQALKELRLLIYELRPPMLEQEGLVGALQQRLDTVENRAGVEARLRVDGEVELAAPVEEALYRIALESLNNALKHAAAPAVTVRIRADGEEVELEVADNGRGFDPHTANGRGGMGLVTMRERAERVGGVLTIQSAPGEGTQVKVRFSNA